MRRRVSKIVIGSMPAFAGAIGALGVNSVVALRYAAVDRSDNVVSIRYAAVACVGALATAAMTAVVVLTGRRASRRWRLTVLPAALLGGVLWEVVPSPPKEVLTVGLLMLFAFPFLAVGGAAAAILFAANWFERRIARTP